MAAVRASVAARRLTRRFLSSFFSSPSAGSASASRTLLGHFHHPTSTARPVLVRSASAPVFQPLSAGSPRLSLDFLSADAATSEFSLFDSHVGLLLLLKATDAGPRFLVCDPVSRRHALLPSLPAAAFSDGEFLSAALLSRAAGSGLEFRAVCLTVQADRLRLWLAWSGDGEVSWLGLPPSRDFRVKWPLSWSEKRCVRAAGSLYWHISNNDSVLALDPNTLRLSYLRAPAVIWDDLGFPNYRIGETPGDGRLCFAALDSQVLRLCARGAGGDDGWVLEREVSLVEEFDALTNLPMACPWLGNIDPGRTGKVFIRTFGHGHFSYDMDTGKLDRLTTDDGQEYGHPIFAYFSAPDGGSSG
ncbi:hypothetical protein SETIT_2G149900v2 [Setaria italica]|uniref:DUF1618 domain-containing protein n=1 Tax=Setaria italica TaxID=4555 RepID=A0A368PZA3_SETIT|nr:hypothetical protein SETIT_2G149900v2 [Setaria italica]